MKLEIGEPFHRDSERYAEQAVVTGLASIDDPLPEGSTVLPKDGDSEIEVRIINTERSDFFHTTVTLRRLVNNWQRGPLPTA